MTELMVLIAGIVGSVIGALVTKVYDDRHSAYGLFSIEPGDDPDDPEVVNLRVRIFNDQDLNDKKRIILMRDTHK